MQTIRRAAAILLAVLFLLASCGKPQDGPVDTIKIGVSVYRQDDTFISLLVDHLNEYAKTYEQIKGVKLQLDFSYAQYNQSLQNDQIDGFLQKDYDVVLVNVVDRTAAGGLVDKAKTAQKPIIFFNREPVREDLDRWRLAYYVGADAAESGELEGRLLVDAYMDDPARLDRNGDGVLQYVMLEGDPGHQDSMIRTETSVRTLTQAGIRTEKLASSIANWQRVQASTKMLLWIEKFGSRIEAVIANNDDMALGALDAYANTGVANLPAIVGIDGTPGGLQAVSDGRMLGTVYNDSSSQARHLIQLACQLAAGESLESLPLTDSKYLLTPYIHITSENAALYSDAE